MAGLLARSDNGQPFSCKYRIACRAVAGFIVLPMKVVSESVNSSTMFSV